MAIRATTMIMVETVLPKIITSVCAFERDNLFYYIRFGEIWQAFS